MPGLTPEELALYRRLAPAMSMRDPNAVPDLGFGPMTPTTISGYPNGEISSQPSPEERIRAIGDMGALPVLARGEAGAFSDATDAGAEAMRDPSLATVSNAGLKTGIAIGSPTLAGASALGGMSLAALKDLGDAIIPKAEAKKRPAPPDLKPSIVDGIPEAAADPMAEKVKGDPQLELLYNAYQDAMRRAGGDVGGRGISKESGDKARAAAAGQAQDIMGKLSVALENKAKAGRDKEKGIYDQQVAEANAARDMEMGRGRRFADTAVGKVYDKMGGLAPMAMGMIPGSVARLARGPVESMGSAALRGGLGAISGVMANNVPLAYNAFSTPVENPEQRAAAAYSFNLPDGHPDKAKFADLAASLPKTNPTRDLAASELYDPKKFAERAVQGGAEGFLGSDLGDMVPGAIGGAFRKSTYQLPEAAIASNAARLSGKPPAIADRIEPTLAPPSALDGAFAAGAPPMRDVTPVGAAPPSAAQAIPSVPTVMAPKTSVQGPNAFDLMTMKPKQAAAKQDVLMARADAQDSRARIQSLAAEVKQVHPNMRLNDIKKMLASNPDLTDLPSITKFLTKAQLAAKTTPGTLSKALEDQFGKSDNGSALLTSGQ